MTGPNNAFIQVLRDLLVAPKGLALPDTPEGAAKMSPARVRYFQALAVEQGTLLRFVEQVIEAEREISGDAGADKLRAAILPDGRVPEDSDVDPTPSAHTVTVDGGTGLTLYRHAR